MDSSRPKQSNGASRIETWRGRRRERRQEKRQKRGLEKRYQEELSRHDSSIGSWLRDKNYSDEFSDGVVEMFADVTFTLNQMGQALNKSTRSLGSIVSRNST